MTRYPFNDTSTAVTREEFADGSAIVSYPDGSMAILESKLARASALFERRAVNYVEPSQPVAIQKKRPVIKQAAGGRKIGHAKRKA